MHAHHLAQRHGEQSIGVGRTKIILDRKGKALDVLNAPDVPRMNAALLECLPVERHLLIGARHLLLQPLSLKFAEFRAWHALRLGVPDIALPAGAILCAHGSPYQSASGACPLRQVHSLSCMKRTPQESVKGVFSSLP